MPVVALLIVSALWGIHPVIGQVVERQLQPLPLTVWRYTLCAVCYLPFLIRIRRWHRLSGRTIGLLALVTLCWAVLYPLFYYQALKSLPPVECLLIVNTSPLMAAALARVFLNEHLRGLAWVGILICFSGVLALVLVQWQGSHSFAGVVMAAAAALAFAFYTMISRSLFQTLPSIDVLMVSSIAGAVLLWVYALATGHLHSTRMAIMSLTAAGWGQLLYIVIMVSAVAYVLYGFGLRRLPTGISAAVSFYPQVVFTALAQWLWLHQAPRIITVVSALLILSGTALLTVRRRRPAQAVS